jgi:hypothetical protein
MRRAVVKRVQHHAVLNIRAVADDDFVHVAAQYGVVPDRTVAADGHVAQNDGRLGQKRIFTDCGRMSPHLFNQSHKFICY